MITAAHLRHIALALCMSFSLAAHASEPTKSAIPEPSPAFWKPTTETGTMYLLGSMHVLPRGFRWLTPVIEKAMADSDVFVFVVSMSGGSIRNGLAHIAGEYRLPKGQTLREKMSAQGKKDFEEIAKELGINVKALDRFRPWVALGIISDFAEKDTDGKYALTYGVDDRVGQFSEQERKPRCYFETSEFQLKMLTRFDEGGIVEFETALKEFKNKENATSFLRISELYVTGDLDGLTKIVDGPSESKSFRKLLLDERNKNWVEQIPAMLKQRRTFFVTVGAAHMWGENSVIGLLCKKGLPTGENRLQDGRGGLSLHRAEHDGPGGGPYKGGPRQPNPGHALSNK